MAPMREERDECAGVVMDGRFFVVSGYGTESQGVFRKSGEVFDPVTGEWRLIANMWPLVSRDSDVANPSSIAAMAGRLYALHGKDVVMYSAEKNAWTVIEKLPEEGDMTPSSIAATGSALVITGLTRKNDTATLKTLSLSPANTKPQWRTVPSNDQFLNLTQTSCSFEM
jgi:N-acetylneuraminic acid mutarotase